MILKYEYSILQYTLKNWALLLNFLNNVFSTECSCLGISGYFMPITLTEWCWCAMVTHRLARENIWQPVLVKELKLVAIWQKWGGADESHSQ